MLLDSVSNIERLGFSAVSGGEVSCCAGDGVRVIVAAAASTGFWADSGGVIDDGGGDGVLLMLRVVILDCEEDMRADRFCDMINRRRGGCAYSDRKLSLLLSQGYRAEEECCALLAGVRQWYCFREARVDQYDNVAQ